MSLRYHSVIEHRSRLEVSIAEESALPVLEMEVPEFPECASER